MNALEKRILNRKRDRFQSVFFNVNNQRLLKDLVGQGIVLKGTLEKVQKNKDVNEKFSLLLKDFEKEPLSFQKICYSLENRGYVNLLDELKAELIVEEGKYRPNNWMISEAEQFSSVNVTYEIAKRFAVAELLCKFSVKRRTKDLITERHLIQSKVKELLGNINKLIKHTNQEGSRDDGKNFDRQKLIDLDLETNKKKAFQLASEKIEQLFKVYQSLERENSIFRIERESCLKLLNCNNKYSRIDEILKETLKDASTEVDKVKTSALKERSNCSTLDSRVRQIKLDTQRSLLVKQDEIENLKYCLVEKDKRIRHLAEENAKNRQRFEFYERELQIAKTRNLVLERSRGLCYSWKDVVGNFKRADLK
ncbi:DgyrCDS12855 [Dimorphilus gyrociliatus]|uniref:DgyrCDS12855 n=1 Tax=Dimorphilus gyrociliatus TaxID=2664684 RepID=A0A7I8W8W9_9ANNE|nr:DgyrCDS12855 [Dimorphilus gyrociliatus]